MYSISLKSVSKPAEVLMKPKPVLMPRTVRLWLVVEKRYQDIQAITRKVAH